MLLAVKNAAFGYDGHCVVRDLDFSVEAGDYLCVVGENGSGKSTLLKGMLRLLPPMQGSLAVSGGIGRNETGYLSQEAAGKKDFPAGAGEIVLSGFAGRMGLRPFYTRGERREAERIMESLGVADMRRRCFRELSGGQQRRVLIARALAASRKLLVLDEPAAGLDPLVTVEVYELLAKLNRETGITLIMVSHDIPAAVKYAKKILHLDGRGHFFGTPEEYLRSGAGKTFFGGEGSRGGGHGE